MYDNFLLLTEKDYCLLLLFSLLIVQTVFTNQLNLPCQVEQTWYFVSSVDWLTPFYEWIIRMNNVAGSVIQSDKVHRSSS